MNNEDKDSKLESNTYSSIIGKELKNIRNKKGWSGAKIASQLGLSQQQYSRYECGRCRITIDILLHVLYILDVDVISFFVKIKICYDEVFFCDISSDVRQDINNYFFLKDEVQLN